MGRNDKSLHFIIFFSLILYIFGGENWTLILAIFLLFTEPITFLTHDAYKYTETSSG